MGTHVLPHAKLLFRTSFFTMIRMARWLMQRRKQDDMLFGGIENGHASMQVREQRSKKEGHSKERLASIHPFRYIIHLSSKDRRYTEEDFFTL